MQLEKEENLSDMCRTKDRFVEVTDFILFYTDLISLSFKNVFIAVADLCVSAPLDVIHGSDTVEEAEREINLWFRPDEILAL